MTLCILKSKFDTNTHWPKKKRYSGAGGEVKRTSGIYNIGYISFSRPKVLLFFNDRKWRWIIMDSITSSQVIGYVLYACLVKRQLCLVSLPPRRRMLNDDKSAFFIPNGIEWLLKREGYVCGLFLVWQVSRRDCKFASESRKGREGKGWNKPPISFPVVRKAWKSPFAQSSSLFVLFIFFFLLPFVKWRRATAPSCVKVIDLWSWRRRDERAYYNTHADTRAHAIPSTQHTLTLIV